MLTRPTTFDEYLDLVHQVVYEVDELRSCNEDDEEEMERYMAFIDPLDAQLRALYAQMSSGDYAFPRNEDLPFMSIVQAFGRHIPFKRLLEIINETHRKGLAGAREEPPG